MRARIERAVAIVLSASAFVLHLLLSRSAGPLWRDEVISLNVAMSPWRQMWRLLNFESFPLAWPLVLRTWISTFGDTIVSLRSGGIVTGVAIIAAIWIAVGVLAGRSPVTALAIAALSGAVIRWGDSVRGYGLGVVTALLFLAAAYRAAATRTRRAWVLAAATAILCVQFTFFNSVVVLAACVALIVSTREVVKPLMLGAISAASLLVYIPVIRARAAWTAIESFGVDVRWVMTAAFSTFASSGKAAAWLAVAAAAVAVVTAIPFDSTQRRFAAALFLMMWLGTSAFLVTLRYAPQPWYLILVLTVSAVCVDALLTNFWLRLAFALAIAGCSIPFAIRYCSLRASNVDVVAGTASALRKPGDAVIVYPWYCGVSFARYASGEWITLPPVSDHIVQRYDLVVPLLGRQDAAAPVAAAITGALQSGHTVWLAGFPLCSESEGMLGDRRTDTPAVRSDAMWCREIGAVLRSNGSRATVVVKQDPQTVIYENMQLIAVER